MKFLKKGSSSSYVRKNFIVKLRTILFDVLKKNKKKRETLRRKIFLVGFLQQRYPIKHILSGWLIRTIE